MKILAVKISSDELGTSHTKELNEKEYQSLKDSYSNSPELLADGEMSFEHWTRPVNVRANDLEQFNTRDKNSHFIYGWFESFSQGEFVPEWMREADDLMISVLNGIDRDVVKKAKAAKCLDGMMAADMELYHKRVRIPLQRAHKISNVMRTANESRQQWMINQDNDTFSEVIAQIQTLEKSAETNILFQIECSGKYKEVLENYLEYNGYNVEFDKFTSDLTLEIESLELDIAKIQLEKNVVVRKRDYERGAKLRDTERQLMDKIETAKKKKNKYNLRITI